MKKSKPVKNKQTNPQTNSQTNKQQKKPEEGKGSCLLLLSFPTQFALLETPAAILLLAQTSLRKQVSPVTFSLCESLGQVLNPIALKKEQ